MLYLFHLWPCRLLGPFDTTPAVFDSFMAFQNDQMFQAHMMFFLLQVWNQLFLQEDFVLLNREWHFETIVWVPEGSLF